MNNFRFKPKLLIFIFSFLILNACGIKKYIPEGERIYRGADIEINADSSHAKTGKLKNELFSVLSPEPNSKILGFYPGLYFYYKNSKQKNSFITRWLYKKIGEEPVYQSDVNTIQIGDVLVNRLENNGFFYSTVNAAFEEKKHKAKAKYSINLAEPYEMKTFQLDSMPMPLYADVKEILQNSPLDTKTRFNLSNLKRERQRLDANLKKRGYYNFSPDFFVFDVDTNQYKNKKFDLYLKLKENLPQSGTLPYRISQINIYPNQTFNDSVRLKSSRYNNKTYFQDSIFIKPKYLDKFITLKEGQLYNPENSKNTARRLSSINIYKFVNIQYTETAATDSIANLQANIYLSPLNKRSLRAEIQAVTKSNNFTGPNLSLTYSNRNLFKGGEVLDISTNFGYETQFASGDNPGLNSLEYGLKTKLSFPRLISPLKIDDNLFEYSIPKTKTSLGINFLNRSELYTLTSVNAQFGYIWNANKFITYEVNPIAVNYTDLTNTTAEFEDILNNNPFLRLSFDQQFIVGLNFSFVYNGMLDSDKTNQFFLNSNLDVAGNSLSLLSQASAGSAQRTFLGIEYAQYAKADIDARYHYKFGKTKKQTLAARLFAGYGFAYGNSEILPYVKQYFSGGPYSVRAFRIRSLGPGTYSGNSDEFSDFFDRTGNIRLEANLEYRFPIYSFLKGAVFTDAGNIWNSEANPAFEGNDVFGPNFLNELGMGSGVGLRIDVQGFVIRFDLAAPFHDPSLPEGERLDFQFDRPILNFAIGYSF